MGYYSNFEITIANEKATVEEIAEPLSQFIGYNVNYLDDKMLLISDAKWYDWRTDMRKFSKQFPWAAIQISRIGEENLDWECSLFVNGKEFNKKIEYIKNITGFKEMTVCEDESEAYEYWKNNFNHNPNDCCNLRI